MFDHFYFCCSDGFLMCWLGKSTVLFCQIQLICQFELSLSGHRGFRWGILQNHLVNVGIRAAPASANASADAHHGTGLGVWRQSDDTEKLGQSDHFNLPVQILMVSPHPNTVATWGLKTNAAHDTIFWNVTLLFKIMLKFLFCCPKFFNNFNHSIELIECQKGAYK